AGAHAAEWDWVKWLPHSQHGTRQDGAGHARLHADGIDALDELLSGEMEGRGRFEAGATPVRDEPYVVVIVDGVDVPPESRLAGTGYRKSIVLNVSSGLPKTPGRATLRLDVTADSMEMVRFDRTGAEIRTPLGRPDRLSVVKATVLARVISPLRLGAT